MKINNENGVKGIFLVIFCISIFLFTRSNGYNILPFSNNIMLYLYSVIGSIVILYLSTSRIKLKAIDILCLVYFIYHACGSLFVFPNTLSHSTLLKTTNSKRYKF